MAYSTKGYRRYVREKAFERLTGDTIKDKWNGNWATKQGHDREAEGILRYEEYMYYKVRNGGFWQVDEWVGGSPDGLVGDNGVVEVKSRTTEVFLENLDFKPTRDEYNQAMGEIYVTDRDWVDLVYTPHARLKPIIYRIERNDGYIEDIKQRIEIMKGQILEDMDYLKTWIV